MSLASRLNDQVVPLAVACERLGKPSDVKGQRTLRAHLRRKGFEVRRLGNDFSVTVATLAAFLRRCQEDSAAFRAGAAVRARAHGLGRYERPHRDA